MQRVAFKMQLKPGFENEYKKRHDEIWPELSQALSDAGISDYSIFLDEESLTLFAVQKLSADNVMRDEYREMAYEYYKTHQDADATFNDLMNTIKENL